MRKTSHTSFITLLYALLLCGVFVALPHTHAAASATSLSDRLDAIKKEIQAAKKLQSVKEKQAAIINRQLRDLTAEATALEKKITQTKEELETTLSDIDRIRKGIAEQERALAGQKKVLAQLIRKQYETGTQSPFARLFLPATFRTDDYVLQTQDKIHATITRIEKLRAKLKKDHAALEEKKKHVEDAKKKLEKRNDYLASARDYKAYLASKTKREITTYTKKIKSLEEEEIAVRREIERIEARKLDNVNLADLPSKNEADFGYPVKKVRISQYYGRTTFSATAYKSGFHNGVDLAGGGDVLAAASGKVIATGDMGRYGYGRWVAIDHGNGLVTLYGHMRKIKTKRGEKVKKGERIGIMGSSGYSTGVHVHFTVFVASSFSVVNSSSVIGLKVPTGASVNPMIYL